MVYGERSGINKRKVEFADCADCVHYNECYKFSIGINILELLRVLSLRDYCVNNDKKNWEMRQ